MVITRRSASTSRRRVKEVKDVKVRHGGESEGDDERDGKVEGVGHGSRFVLG